MDGNGMGGEIQSFTPSLPVRLFVNPLTKSLVLQDPFDNSVY